MYGNVEFSLRELLAEALANKTKPRVDAKGGTLEVHFQFELKECMWSVIVIEQVCRGRFL